MERTAAIARFISGQRYEELPPQTVMAAKRALLDTCGAMLFGTSTEWAMLGKEYARRYGSPGASPVIGSSNTASARDAALLNGLFAHGFELDDTHVESVSHPGGVVVPAALAVLPECEPCGRQFITALVIGYDVMGRVGAAVSPAHIAGGFHPTATAGVFGAAAAAAVMLNLPESETLAALGIAGSLCSGITEFANDSWGDMIKRLHAGKAAESGVMAAHLAASGYRGPRSVLDGRNGFLRTFAEKSNPSRLVKDLGGVYEVEAVSFKPYACCSNIFCVVDALKELMTSKVVQSADVHSVVVHTNRDSVQYHSRNTAIDTVGAAQYSIPYVVAATFAGIVEDPTRAFSPAALADPGIVEVARRTTVELDREMDALFPNVEGARVAIRLRDGRTFESVVTSALGSIHRPLGQEQLEAKFKMLAAHVLTADAADQFIHLVSGLESLADIRPVISLLCPPSQLDAPVGNAGHSSRHAKQASRPDSGKG